MSEYISPYKISDRMLELVSSISEKVGRITTHKELESKPHLRRNNRIRSIHSSLKIEANSLSLNEVRDVINGRLVLGDQKEIQEVKNAYAAYEKITEIDCLDIADLKKIHGIMTHGIVEESGVFRRGDEGMFSGNKCIFIAPPPERVYGLIKDLFSWMKKMKQRYIRLSWRRYSIMKLCLYILLLTEMVAWQGSGTQPSYTNGEASLPIFLWKARSSDFRPTITMPSPKAMSKATRIFLLNSCSK